eukprot:1020911-Pyramimonas_sp.AAC.1
MRRMCKKKKAEREAAKAAAAGAGRGRGKGRGKGKGKAEPDPAKFAKVLSMVPEGALTQPQLARMCPPEGHIWNDWTNGAWAGHLKPHPRAHAPWAMGHRAAALEVLRTLWLQYFWPDTPASECPVKGLFDGEELET